MKIAYLSPLNPMKSGISDFSEELIMELKKYVTIDLYTDNYKPTNNYIIQNFKIFSIDNIESNKSEYDLIVYQIGNNHKYHKKIVDKFLKLGGVLELHDISLHHYVAADTLQNNSLQNYIDIMEYSHGKKGRKYSEMYIEGKLAPLWETRSLEFTVNKNLIDKADALIVHSDMAKQMVKAIRQNLPVVNIPLHADISELDSTELKIKDRGELGISPDELVVGSFGFASKEKRIVSIMQAIRLYIDRTKKDIKYYIVGELTDKNIIKSIEELDLKSNVIITGYTDLTQFQKYMSACDLCLNLRYPTQGESSASLHRMLGMGKPVIVSDVGTFSEYPDNIALKVRYDSNEVEDIYEVLCFLTNEDDKIKITGIEAKTYAKNNFSLEKNAKKYFDFFLDISNNNFRERDYTDIWVDRIFEFNLENSKYVNHILDLISGIYNK